MENISTQSRLLNHDNSFFESLDFEESTEELKMIAAPTRKKHCLSLKGASTKLDEKSQCTEKLTTHNFDKPKTEKVENELQKSVWKFLDEVTQDITKSNLPSSEKKIHKKEKFNWDAVREKPNFKNCFLFLPSEPYKPKEENDIQTRSQKIADNGLRSEKQNRLGELTNHDKNINKNERFSSDSHNETSSLHFEITPKTSVGSEKKNLNSSKSNNNQKESKCSNSSDREFFNNLRDENSKPMKWSESNSSNLFSSSDSDPKPKIIIKSIVSIKDNEIQPLQNSENLFSFPDSDPKYLKSEQSSKPASFATNPKDSPRFSGDVKFVNPEIGNDANTQLSQFFKSTYFLQQLDKVAQEANSSAKPKADESFKMPTVVKRKSLENSGPDAKILKTDHENTVDTGNPTSRSIIQKLDKEHTTELKQNKIGTDIVDTEHELSQLFTSSEMRKEVSHLFEKLEQSICQLGPEPKEDWGDDSFMDKAIDKIEQGESLNDIFKKALTENAKKDIEPANLVNQTVVEKQATFTNLGSFYGLPEKVKDLVRSYKGISSLYDWQDECLNLPAVKERKNLIYSLPTSGGKTLVAEILILREILCRRKNAVFILPYVAIVQEKVWALSPFAVSLDFLIEEYAAGKGCYPPKKRRHKNSVYIATTEKALGLVNSLVEQGRLGELGLVVVDELHLIGDEQRGPTLETLLSKLIYLNEDVQIVGMSATIGNLYDIQKFLRAEVYTRNFRPVELMEYVKCGNQIAKINYGADSDNVFQPARTVGKFHYPEAVTKIDPDHLGGLVMEVVPKDSCLLFCSSKRSCENVAHLLCKIVFPSLKKHKTEEKQLLINALKNESGTLCNILQNSVPFGIAYHHSGLTSEERKLIEEAYRNGILCVICCTSTLAAGVNLPAKRVIIRKPFIANDFISLSRYKQMIGRAGRAGLGEKGESILICDPKELPRVKDLLMSPMDQTLSRIHNCIYLRHLFLSCIALGVANTRTQLEKVAAGTLLAIQEEKLEVNIKMLVKKAITELFVLGAIQMSKDKFGGATGSLTDVSICLNSSVSQIPELNTSHSKKKKRRLYLERDDKLIVTKLGNAAIKGCLELSQAHLLYEDLKKAQDSLVLVNSLHLLYLVTPYSILEQVRVEKNHIYTIMTRLGETERKTAAILGITDFAIVRLYSNQSIKGVDERVLYRFYSALMLYDLWNETSVIHVSEKYRVNRGIVQNLMSSASSFASNVVNFCEELEEFWAFSHLLKGMSQRLAHCCCRELLPLMELPAVKQSRARQLYNAGFRNLQSIARANPNDLLQPIEFMSRRLANQLIAAAKLLLLEKVETLREEAEDVLDGVDKPKIVFNHAFLK